MTINLDKIRAIPIASFMVNIGHSIKSTTAANIFFDSPFRAEKTASFSVWTKRNLWKDFGSGEGGDIIELAQRIWKVDFKEAIQRLNKQSYPIEVSSIILKLPKVEIQLKKTVNKVQNNALLNYMKERNLQPNKLTGLVGEIYYLQNKKNYFGLAFKNDLGGFEIRNKYFKGCYGQKHFTTIKKGFDSVTVFEGFIDLLSLLSWEVLKSDILVLNSCAIAPKSIPIINQYQKAYLMLDNDKTGNHTTDLISHQSNAKTVDLRYLYQEFKDLNDWIKTKYQKNG